jgi:DNA polymerase I
MKYVTDLATLSEIVDDILQNPSQWIGCDTETTGLNCHENKLRLVQLDVVKETYVLDTWRVSGWQDEFSKLLQQKKLKWVFHNFKFDLKFFWANKLDFFKCKVLDTMICSALINAGLDRGNSLAEVSERYLDIPMDKTEQKSDWSVGHLTESQLEYAAKDARNTRLLASVLLPLLKKQSLEEVFKLEMRALYSFASMEFFGITIDLDRLETLRPIYEDKLNTAEEEFLALVPNLFNRKNLKGQIVNKGLELSSSAQVLEVLRELEIPNPIYNPKGRTDEELDLIIPSTGANIIKLLDIPDYPILEALIGHRKASKLLTSYVYSFPHLINSVTGKLHTNFRQMVSTGRASSSNPNLQNLSRPDGSELNLRSCFIPSEGYNLIDADYSQIELRVIAEIIYNLSGDRKMLDEFIEGKDPYLATAALMAGLDYYSMFEDGSVKKIYKSLRQNAKAVRLGYNYGMGYRKFRTYAKISYGVSMTEEEAKANRALYFAAYPGLQVYHNTFSDKETDVVYSLPPYNRPRYFSEYPGIPALANHPVQSTSADIQKLAQAMMYEALYDRGFSPVHSTKMRQLVTIHDEIVSEATNDYVEECKQLQQNSMEEAARVVLSICPIDAGAECIKNLAMK